MADSSELGYKYSGTEMIVEPFHATVLPLKVRALPADVSHPSHAALESTATSLFAAVWPVATREQAEDTGSCAILSLLMHILGFCCHPC